MLWAVGMKLLWGGLIWIFALYPVLIWVFSTFLGTNSGIFETSIFFRAVGWSSSWEWACFGMFWEGSFYNFCFASLPFWIGDLLCETIEAN